MIDVSLVVACGLLTVAFLRRRSAALRHWVLSATLACAAGVPALQLVVPAWDLAPAAAPAPAPVDHALVTAVIQEARPQHAAVPATKPDTTPDRFRAETVGPALAALWIAGSGICVFVLLVGFGRLAWLASRSRRLTKGVWRELTDDISRDYGVRRTVLILQSEHPTLLVTWGLRTPKVILPIGASDWPEDRVRVVLSHELAHIRRADWAAHVMAEVLRAAYWFNPLLWIARRRLRDESEQACDNAVLNQGIDASVYATHLLELARAARRHRPTWISVFPAPAMMRPSSLERRVTAMLNTRLDRKPTSPLVRVVATVGFLFMAVLIVGFGAAAQSGATLSGTVVDPSGSPVPRVAVALANVRSEAKYEVPTDPNGRFEFVALPPGDYAVDVRFPGFRNLRTNLTMAGQNVERRLALQVGTLTETVTVSGDPRGATRPSPAPAARRAARTPQECTATPAGGNIRPPRKLTHVSPAYPASLQRSGVKGSVKLEGTIGTDGFIRDLKVVGEVNPDLAAAAVEAVRQWEFDATLLNCVPIDVSITITISFDQEK